MKWLERMLAIASKETRQLLRDRVTFGLIVGIPAMQIVLFGYAINFDVRDLDAVVLDQARTSLSRQRPWSRTTGGDPGDAHRLAGRQRGGVRAGHAPWRRQPRRGDRTGPRAASRGRRGTGSADRRGRQPPLAGERGAGPGRTTAAEAPGRGQCLRATGDDPHRIQPREAHGGPGGAGAGGGDPQSHHGDLHRRCHCQGAGAWQPRAADHHAGVAQPASLWPASCRPTS